MFSYKKNFISMNQFGGYVTVKVGEIAPAKLRKALEGSTVRLSNAELTGDRVMIVHPLNAKSIKKAQKEKKGVSTQFSSGEIAKDLEYHDSMGGALHGGSVWGWLKNKALPWVKKNWDVIKPIVSRVVDTAVPMAASAFGQPELGAPAREAVKQLTGVGLKKGSPEMKAKMAALRSKRKAGGSFRMP